VKIQTFHETLDDSQPLCPGVQMHNLRCKSKSEYTWPSDRKTDL